MHVSPHHIEDTAGHSRTWMTSTYLSLICLSKEFTSHSRLVDSTNDPRRRCLHVASTPTDVVAKENAVPNDLSGLFPSSTQRQVSKLESAKC